MTKHRQVRDDRGDSLRRGGDATVRPARSLTELRPADLAGVHGGGHVSSGGSRQPW